MSTTTATAARYVGWLRPSKAHPWEPIATGNSWEEVMDKTFFHPAAGKHVEIIVLERGRSPIGRVKRGN